jgi:hypothetical protein
MSRLSCAAQGSSRRCGNPIRPSGATRVCPEEALDEPQQVINWGYVVTDMAIRAHVKPTAARPTQLPFG